MCLLSPLIQGSGIEQPGGIVLALHTICRHLVVVPKSKYRLYITYSGKLQQSKQTHRLSAAPSHKIVIAFWTEAALCRSSECVMTCQGMHQRLQPKCL